MPDNMAALYGHNHVINDSLKSSSNIRMQITQTRKRIFGINSHTKNARMCDCISNYCYHSLNNNNNNNKYNGIARAAIIGK